ncbi:YwqG family protein [Lentzea cavernae]|uniref:DUF1963 domain-containing protein n=1 Tax=Lentzea cavernae TaxID=2020703 RepID=A0ABQ3MG35_9PSEU|nr:YwqG family protein [Lentzea cavernae]GHH42410.1 hypothetical protein GCM10017774_38740 [Lentzea cavernae]
MINENERLGVIARQELPHDIASAWIALFRPAVRFRTADTGVRVGQLGGDPSLPTDMEWPACEAGPLNHIATVDCAALPRQSLDVPLPSAGSLLFFYLDGSYSPDGSPDPLGQGARRGQPEGARVIFIPAGAAVRGRPTPAGLRRYSSADLTAEPVVTGPSREHVLLHEVRLESGLSLAEAAEEVEVGEGAEGEDVFTEVVYLAGGEGPRHQVGGYSDPIQGAAESEIASLVLDGGFQNPRFAAEAAEWVLLAQFGSDPAREMLWGDVGSLYWLIRRDDLAAGRFDLARFTLQTG